MTGLRPDGPDLTPSKPDAEAAVLGACLLSSSAIEATLAEGLEASDFYMSANRSIFEAIQKLSARGDPVDVITAVEELRRCGDLERVGGPLYVRNLTEEILTPAAAAHHARFVREASEARWLIHDAADAQNAAARGDLESARAILAAPADRLPSTFRPEPVDLEVALAEGVPEPEFVVEPYLARNTKTHVFGPAASGKSMFLAHIAAGLTRRGIKVAFVSQENPLFVDVKRFGRLGADLENLRLYHGQGFDLASTEHVRALIDASRDAGLVVIDTVSAAWSGDENSNDEWTRLDREAWTPLVLETGAALALIDHTGHPKAFVNRSGVNAGRGASAKAQKADLVFELRSTRPGEFTVYHAKNRLGATTVGEVAFRIVDTEDGGLTLEELDRPPAEDAVAIEAKVLQLLAEQPDTFTKTALGTALGRRKDQGVRAVEHLLAEGRIGPNRARAKLRIIDPNQGVIE